MFWQHRHSCLRGFCNIYFWRKSMIARAICSIAASVWVSNGSENRTAKSGCATSTLRGLARSHLGVEFRRFAARDRQGFPIRSGEMFGEIDDLSHVVGIMRHLTVNGLHDGVRLAADISCAGEIGVRQRCQRVKRKLPARFPKLQ